MEAIETVEYKVLYDPVAQKIAWSGVVRLREEEYQLIAELLEKAANSQAEEITVDLRELSFLNSGGINILSRFLLKVRNHQTSNLTILANQAHAWQRKSLRNLQRLMRGVKMDLVWD
jgi:hypothetical protein